MTTRSTFSRILIALIATFGASLVLPSNTLANSTCDNLPPDHCLRLNQVQVLGSHNSYKRWPHQALIDLLDSYRPDWARDISYEHPPLKEQLGRLGLRQFELDVFADPEGGRFAAPAGGMLIQDAEIEQNLPVMSQPGLKVLHSQDTDYRSNCLTFRDCLREIRDWSLQHPDHLPIMVMIELKDAPRADWGPLQYTVPVPFDQTQVLSVDTEIWQVFAPNHVITPDMVRGTAATLEQAVLTTGWPTLAHSRGKVLFALDNTGRHRDLYLEDAETLQNRALFVSMTPGHPAAGFIKMNDALRDSEQIRNYVASGYLVRTRSDVPSHEARTGDTTRREMALQSAAQYISTDYAEPSPFGSGYQVVLPEGSGTARCNPVSAPAACRADWLSE